MTAEVDGKILRKLEEWEQREDRLPGPVELYQQLLAIQVEAKASVTVSRLSFSEESVVSHLSGGKPLLSFENMALDWVSVQRLFRKAIAIIVKHSEDASKEAADLESLASDLAALAKAAQAWYEGSSLQPSAEARGINEELLTFVLQITLHPYLAVHSETLIDLVPQESWRRGYCPICGGSPDFAFLTTELGARWLLCSRCDAQWLFQRLQCPYCDNRDQSALAYFTDDNELYRLYVCERCRRYLKAIDLRQTEEEILLPLERVLTAEMDKQAQETGYEPGPPRASVKG